MRGVISIFDYVYSEVVFGMFKDYYVGSFDGIYW